MDKKDIVVKWLNELPKSKWVEFKKDLDALLSSQQGREAQDDDDEEEDIIDYVASKRELLSKAQDSVIEPQPTGKDIKEEEERVDELTKMGHIYNKYRGLGKWICSRKCMQEYAKQFQQGKVSEISDDTMEDTARHFYRMGFFQDKEGQFQRYWDEYIEELNKQGLASQQEQGYTKGQIYELLNSYLAFLIDKSTDKTITGKQWLDNYFNSIPPSQQTTKTE